MKIQGIDTSIAYTLSDARKALEGAPKPEFGEQNHGIFFYEMWPLVWVMEYMNAGDTDTLRFSDGKRTDDGLVILNGTKEAFQFTEASNKKQGKHESIRMEHLDKYGRAPAVQDMKWEGKKNNRTLAEQDTVTFESGEILKKLHSLIEDAINRKNDDKYKRMSLGIVFDDHMLFPVEKARQEYVEIFESVIKKHSDQLEKIYPKVFFIGKSGKHIKHYDLNFTEIGRQ